MKPSAIRLLQQRVQEAGLTNVMAQLGRIEEYTGRPMCELWACTRACYALELHCTFTAVDMKPSALSYQQQPVQEAGLTNVDSTAGTHRGIHRYTQWCSAILHGVLYVVLVPATRRRPAGT